MVSRLTPAKEGHATRPGKFMILDPDLLNQLLGHDIAGTEEDRGGDALGEDRACCQLGSVPIDR